MRSLPRQVLEKEVFPLVSGFYDTPFIVWLLKTRPAYAAKVFFEDQIGINRHFVAVDWGTETPLVSHFAGINDCVVLYILSVLWQTDRAKYVGGKQRGSQLECKIAGGGLKCGLFSERAC